MSSTRCCCIPDSSMQRDSVPWWCRILRQSAGKAILLGKDSHVPSVGIYCWYWRHIMPASCQMSVTPAFSYTGCQAELTML